MLWALLPMDSLKVIALWSQIPGMVPISEVIEAWDVRYRFKTWLQWVTNAH